MKKILLGIALSVVVLQGCKKDDDNDEETSTIIIAETTDEQNTWDDTSITKFLDEHYFDAKGNVVAFDDAIETDNNEKKLSAYDVVKLNSGVVYVKREDSLQPNPGKTINTDDAITIMQNTTAYVAAKNITTGNISLTSGLIFSNTITGSGVPIYDPAYYYVKKTVVDTYNTTNSTSYDKSFYQIEGFIEGLKNFKSFDLTDAADYNLQGVIIVPSRAAFARDVHYPYNNSNWNNRTFVFNFQIYNTKTRAVAGD
ncbi:hypothetical protein PQ459_06485 [Chryseobacterium sp. KACC 21268]|nr:hypothetical protein PQ459_06485 [Chryseobacterium sp. KACC 21268]